MVTVKKGNMVTEILDHLQEKYLNAGWKVIRPKLEIIEDEATNIIANSLQVEQSAVSRKKNVNTSAINEAKVIVAKELKKKEAKTFTDNLIKE